MSVCTSVRTPVCMLLCVADMCILATLSQFAHQVLNLALVAASAIIIWKGLIVVSGSESPVVVVLSGSMVPSVHGHAHCHVQPISCACAMCMTCDMALNVRSLVRVAHARCIHVLSGTRLLSW